EVKVLIPRGIGVGDVAKILKKQDLIRSITWFKIRAKLSGRRPIFYSGLMRLNVPASTSSLIRQLQERDRLTYYKITVPEGYHVLQIDQLLSESGLLKKGEFQAFVASPNCFRTMLESSPSLSIIPKTISTLEGYLFPDTYFLDGLSTPYEIAQKMLLNFSSKVAPLYLQYQQVQPHRGKRSSLKMKSTDYYSVLIIASIVENEAKLDEERPLVASVYLNRLRLHMALGSCPTVHYARAQQGLPHEETISLVDLKIDSPYNTYRHAGLPPSPISNPGIRSIQATLYPSQTDYLYFVSLRNGHHHFSKSGREHAQWVSKVSRESVSQPLRR
ncbi:MAG: endolytic transglycosylase MltG, partial [Candidatus Margulisiibacteriota bacterium]